MARIGKVIGSTLLAGALASTISCAPIVANIGNNEPNSTTINYSPPVINGGGYVQGGVVVPYGPSTYYYSSPPPVVYFNSGVPYPYYYGWGPSINFNYGHGHGGHGFGHGRTIYRPSSPAPYCPPTTHRQQRR